MSESQPEMSDMKTITIPVDSDLATIYEAASPEDQQKIALLLNLWLRDIVTARNTSLQNLIQTVSERAKERGLTAEILEELLADNE